MYSNRMNNDILTVIRGVLLSAVYILVDRNIYILQHLKGLETLYNYLLLLIWCISFLCIFLFIIRKKKRHLKVLGCVSLLLFSLLISTVIGNGDLRRWFSISYPLFAVNAVILLFAQQPNKFKYFIHVISFTYLMLAFINMSFMVLYPSCFGDIFFLGGENLLGYTLLVGFLYNALDYYLNNSRIKFIIYSLIHIITLLLVWSGATVLGFFFIVCCLFIPFANVIIRNLSLSFLCIIYVAFYIIVVFFNSAGIFDDTVIESVIVDVLGKDMTFTGRTYIWMVVIWGIMESPFIGHGIRETGDLFDVYIPRVNQIPFQGTFSAHNQFLQILYEGGMMAIIIVVLSVVMLNNLLKQCNNKKINVLFKSVFIAFLLMIIGEAPGLNAFCEILILCFIVPSVFDNFKNSSICLYQ